MLYICSAFPSFPVAWIMLIFKELDNNSIKMANGSQWAQKVEKKRGEEEGGEMDRHY